MIFPNTFFHKEIRDDFLIPEMMKRAWAATIEVLEVIDNICKTNDITYFADWGTLLGAVRHNGFIPWDDDIDISMLRKDYMKFISLLNSSLPEGFVIAGMYSDDIRLQEASKVQQLRIIADEKYWSLPSYMNRFHGFPCFRIGIDIFPLDYMNPNEKIESQINDIYFYTMNILTHWSSYSLQNDFEDKIRLLENIYSDSFWGHENLYNEIWKASDHLISSSSPSEYVTNYFYKCIYSEQKKNCFKFKSSWFSSIEDFPFEFFKIPCPTCYDKILSVEYGDYMVPKKEYDTHSYPFYKTQLDAFEKLLRESGITTSPEDFCRNWMKANNII